MSKDAAPGLPKHGAAQPCAINVIRDRDAMGAENHDDVIAAVTDPATVRVMLEDDSAGLHVDREHDEADQSADRRIRCPTLVAWSSRDDMDEIYGDPAAIWERWCAQPVKRAVVDSGHMAEDSPDQLAATLVDFLST